MKKSLVEIYALAVCFILVIAISFSLAFGIYGVLKITIPETTMSSWVYQQHQSNVNFIRDWKCNDIRDLFPDEKKLTAMREDSFRAGLRNEQRDGVQSLINVLIALVVQSSVFAIHWYLAKRKRQVAD